MRRMLLQKNRTPATLQARGNATQNIARSRAGGNVGKIMSWLGRARMGIAEVFANQTNVLEKGSFFHGAN